MHVSKPGGVGRFMSNLTRKKNNTTTETFRLSLKRTLVSKLLAVAYEIIAVLIWIDGNYTTVV